MWANEKKNQQLVSIARLCWYSNLNFHTRVGGIFVQTGCLAKKKTIHEGLFQLIASFVFHGGIRFNPAGHLNADMQSPCVPLYIFGFSLSSLPRSSFPRFLVSSFLVASLPRCLVASCFGSLFSLFLVAFSLFARYSLFASCFSLLAWCTSDIVLHRRNPPTSSERRACGITSHPSIQQAKPAKRASPPAKTSQAGQAGLQASWHRFLRLPGFQASRLGAKVV